MAFQKVKMFYRFSKTTQIQNFQKICPVCAELLYDDHHDAANSIFTQCLVGVHTQTQHVKY
jgi:hypothetical protein